MNSETVEYFYLRQSYRNWDELIFLQIPCDIFFFRSLSSSRLFILCGREGVDGELCE